MPVQEILAPGMCTYTPECPPGVRFSNRFYAKGSVFIVLQSVDRPTYQTHQTHAALETKDLLLRPVEIINLTSPGRSNPALLSRKRLSFSASKVDREPTGEPAHTKPKDNTGACS